MAVDTPLIVQTLYSAYKETKTFTIALTLDGEPVNPTGGDVRFGVVKVGTRTPLIVTKSFAGTGLPGGITIADSPGGLVAVEVVPADTAALESANDLWLVGDVKFKPASSSQVFRVARIVWKLSPDYATQPA